MQENKTDEFSFLLKPSEHGVGVFAAHDIKKGTYLRLFGDEQNLEDRAILRQKDNIPEPFRDYCAHRGETLLCPKDFGAMPIGWYLNHSREANAAHKEYHWYASRDIKIGEEILIDYNTLEEPESVREAYY